MRDGRVHRGNARTASRIGAAVTGAWLVLVAGGCNIVGPAVIIAKGPPKYDARYELDGERATVVFIDDRSNALPRRALADTLSRSVEATLLGEKVVEEGKLIASRGAVIAARQDRFGTPISIAEIGQAVDADQVIYAELDRFELSPDGVSVRPGATVRLKVIDVDSGERLWPEEERLGMEVSIDMPQQQGTLPGDRAGRLRLEEALAAYVGRGIGQIFYRHRVTESNLD